MTHTAAVRVDVAAVVLDVRDLAREARFWSALLGSTVLARGPGWVDVALLGVSGPVLSLQQAPGRRRRRGGVHLDVVVSDFEPAVDRAVALGASPVSTVSGGTASSQVLADPEGHRFCLVQGGRPATTG